MAGPKEGILMDFVDLIFILAKKKGFSPWRHSCNCCKTYCFFSDHVWLRTFLGLLQAFSNQELYSTLKHQTPLTLPPPRCKMSTIPLVTASFQPTEEDKTKRKKKSYRKKSLQISINLTQKTRSHIINKALQW